MLSFDVEMVSPAAATRYLTKNTVNRPIKKSHIDFLAESMKRGEWLLNGESIKFATDGRLIDGQHRLHAVIRSQCTVPIGVLRGMESAAFKTIDTGVARTGTDILSLESEKNPAILSAVLKILACYEQGRLAAGIRTTAGRVSNTTQLATLARHPSIRAWVAASMDARNIVSMPILAALCYLSNRGSNGDLVHKFIADVVSGAELRGDNPAFQLRERMLGNRGGKRKISRIEIGALTIKSLNSYRASRPVKLLKWDMVREEFPAIDP